MWERKYLSYDDRNYGLLTLLKIQEFDDYYYSLSPWKITNVSDYFYGNFNSYFDYLYGRIMNVNNYCMNISANNLIFATDVNNQLKPSLDCGVIYHQMFD